MKKRYLLVLSLMTIIFLSGCSVTEVKVKSLTNEQASKESLLIVANTDIECIGGGAKLIVAKDTILKPYDLAGKTYYSKEESKLVNFPDESIYLELWKINDHLGHRSLGYLIYPNGQFVYENYQIVLITGFDGTAGIPSQLYTSECKYKGKIVFTSKKNKNEN